MPNKFLINDPLVPVIPIYEMEGDGSAVLYFPVPEGWNTPDLFTPKTVNAILDDVAQGLSLKDASIRQGIKPTTAEGWRKRNYGNFAGALAKAEIESKYFHILRINDARNGIQVRASAWMLEKKYAEEFGKSIDINHGIKETPVTQKFKIGGREVEF